MAMLWIMPMLMFMGMFGARHEMWMLMYLSEFCWSSGNT